MKYKFKIGDRVINILNECIGEICDLDPLDIGLYRIRYDNYDYDYESSIDEYIGFEVIAHDNISNLVSECNIKLDLSYYRDRKIDDILT